jgi:DNA-binding MarR family transcriptional regulator
MTLVEQVAAVRRTLYRLFTRRLAARSDRPFTQLQALWAISIGEGCSQAALAERLLMDAPAVSRLVDRLEEEGLLKRKPSEEDRRRFCLEVTAAGTAELKAWKEVVRWTDGEMRRHLTPAEADTLGRLLGKLSEGLRAEGGP